MIYIQAHIAQLLTYLDCIADGEDDASAGDNAADGGAAASDDAANDGELIPNALSYTYLAQILITQPKTALLTGKMTQAMLPTVLRVMMPPLMTRSPPRPVAPT